MPVDYGLLKPQQAPQMQVMQTPQSPGILDQLGGVMQQFGDARNQQIRAQQMAAQQNQQAQQAQQLGQPSTTTPPSSPNPYINPQLNTTNAPIKGARQQVSDAITLPDKYKNIPGLIPTMQSLSQIESNHNYKSVGPQTHGGIALGRYQIMSSNLPSWSKAAIGREVSQQEFLSSPALQDNIAAYQISNIMKTNSPANTASVWFSGRPADQAGNSSDALGTTVPQYVNNFLHAYNQYSSR